MNRLAVALVAGLMLAPVAVRADTLVDQYGAAFAMFADSYKIGSALEARRAAEALVAGLQGSWVPLDAIAGGQADLDMTIVERACGKRPAQLTSDAGYRFDLSVTNSAGKTVTYVYSYTSWPRFSVNFDDANMLEYLGIDDPTSEAAAKALERIHRAAEVAVLHPSPDILIIDAGDSRPVIWGRCP